MIWYSATHMGPNYSSCTFHITFFKHGFDIQKRDLEKEVEFDTFVSHHILNIVV